MPNGGPGEARRQSMPNGGPAEPNTAAAAADDAESHAAGSRPNADPGDCSGTVTIVIPQPPVEAPQTENCCKSKGEAVAQALGEVSAAAAADEKKLRLSRSDSEGEDCRVCQQHTDEPLIDLGCRCRGELAKAHRSCIETWFRTRGSNQCEICQQVAANVPAPEPLQSRTTYRVWRINPAYGRANFGRREHERACFSPLWIAFAILLGGLMLDGLVSVSLGVSAVPMNVIIGVLIIMGLATVVRVVLECFEERNPRRNTTINPLTINPAYLPAV